MMAGLLLFSRLVFRGTGKRWRDRERRFVCASMHTCMRGSKSTNPATDGHNGALKLLFHCLTGNYCIFFFVLSVLQDNVRIWHFYFHYIVCIKESFGGFFSSFCSSLWVWILSYCSKILTETKLQNSFWRDVVKAGNETHMQTRLIIYVMLLLLTFIIILIISQLLHSTDLSAGLGDIC